MHNPILTALMLFISVFQVSAQFYTITKECAISVPQKAIIMDSIDNKKDSISDIAVTYTVSIKVPEKENCLSNTSNDKKSDDSVSRCQRQRIEQPAPTDNLPELTIPNPSCRDKEEQYQVP